ncbi:hypothetical protein DAEQUDRAFT_762229 [Daedalea quercina L-15889]|uniref:Uncharacterized protein n=1 Tax=Daedalea quercina L-15889 TaxID=1314783 RepID=A0A165TEB2_9APHY|nr:hypothetical protein DAEQUDRAFT_762229 [Daedalea quercina L-15889]
MTRRRTAYGFCQKPSQGRKEEEEGCWAAAPRARVCVLVAGSLAPQPRSPSAPLHPLGGLLAGLGSPRRDRPARLGARFCCTHSGPSGARRVSLLLILILSRGHFSPPPPPPQRTWVCVRTRRRRAALEPGLVAPSLLPPRPVRESRCGRRIGIGAPLP